MTCKFQTGAGCEDSQWFAAASMHRLACRLARTRTWTEVVCPSKREQAELAELAILSSLGEGFFFFFSFSQGSHKKNPKHINDNINDNQQIPSHVKPWNIAIEMWRTCRGSTPLNIWSLNMSSQLLPPKGYEVFQICTKPWCSQRVSQVVLNVIINNNETLLHSPNYIWLRWISIWIIQWKYERLYLFYTFLCILKYRSPYSNMA